MVRALPAEQRAEAGRRVLLECHIAACPPPRVQWSVGGRRVETDARHIDQRADNGLCSFELIDVQPADVGLYMCKAENELGAASTCCLLQLLPSGGAGASGFTVVRHLPREVSAIDGDEVLIDLQVSAIPPDAHPPHIVWYRDNELLAGDDDFESSFDSRSGRVALRIRQVFPDDAGVISCVIAHPFNREKLVERTILHVLEASPLSGPDIRTLLR